MLVYMHWLPNHNIIPLWYSPSFSIAGRHNKGVVTTVYVANMQYKQDLRGSIITAWLVPSCTREVTLSQCFSVACMLLIVSMCIQTYTNCLGSGNELYVMLRPSLVPRLTNLFQRTQKIGAPGAVALAAFFFFFLSDGNPPVSICQP